MTPVLDRTIALRGVLKENEPMARHVSWRAGGHARRFYQPADLADLQVFLPTLVDTEPILFIGLGSNLLVRGNNEQGGFEGTVILTTPKLGGLVLDAKDQTLVTAGAGVPSPHVARFAARHDLGGAEWLAGIPGTIGGALAMNAGCYGTETWERVVRCRTINRAGELNERTIADYNVGYRHVEAKPLMDKGDSEEWFVDAQLRLVPQDAKTAEANIKALLAKRMASQPLDKPNAGSTFRNPPGDFAARLIESCGLKGYTIGGAQVSEKHANFIINTGHASAADIERLIEHLRETVRAKTGVELVQEVKIVGSAT